MSATRTGLNWVKRRDMYQEDMHGYVIDTGHGGAERWLLFFETSTRKYTVLFRGRVSQCLQVAEIHAVQNYPL